jgi:hypothetical protein
MKYPVVLGATALLAACAATAPVLTPNAHLQKVGPEQARRDVFQCKGLADQSVRPSAAERAALEAAVGPKRGDLVGVSPGAGGGAPVVTNIPPGSAAAGSVMSAEGTPAWKEFVVRCLEQRGYEVTGWQ